MNCRHCTRPLEHVFLDLGFAPPSNAYLTADDLHAPETWYPLKLYVCAHCWLVQTEDYARADELFRPDYAYFSSTSSGWLEHARCYVDAMRERLALGPDSFVIEVAANDGYLLRHLVAAGIPCLGIEPTASTAAAARARGIENVERFFGRNFADAFAQGRGKASLIIANNVLAHVPDLNDFVAGLAIALADEGCITVEFPHLLQLVEQCQFDTVYHEHFSYFSFHTVQKVFACHGLRIWDVEELSTHGGSLRLWSCHDGASRKATPAVPAMLSKERDAGMFDIGWYQGFQAQADRIKHELLAFLLDCKRNGKKIVGYGAAAKGNTLLNYAGVRPDLLPYVVDASPHKQGRYLPGSRIPVVTETRILETRPDFVLILPWNLREEIKTQLAYIRAWGGRFVTCIPEREVS